MLVYGDVLFCSYRTLQSSSEGAEDFGMNTNENNRMEGQDKPKIHNSV